MIIRFNNKEPQIQEAAFIAPDAMLIGDIHLGKEASVWFGAVLRADNAPITIGEASNIQDRAVLHVDPGLPLTIGPHVTVGHSAVLHGCTIGANTVIGMGAIVLNKAIIGKNSIVGAGALVTEGAHFPDGSLIVGSPAVLKKELKALHFQKIHEGALHYVTRSHEMQVAVSQAQPSPTSVLPSDTQT